MSEEYTADGVKLSSRESGVACAKCTGVLEIASVEGFKIAACRSCEGLLVEARLLAKIIGLARANYEGPEIAPQPLDPSELRMELQCVVCLNTMDTHPYCGPGSVVIDSCHHCGLIWLDRQELNRIVEAPGRRELLAADLMDFDRDNPTVGFSNMNPSVDQTYVDDSLPWLFLY